MRPADWSGHTLLERACRLLFVWERGSLSIDDTVLPKPFATAMDGPAWVFSSQERRPGLGFSLVLWVWTHGVLPIPLGIRLWHKGGLRSTTRLWSCSAMLVTACVAALNTWFLTPGIHRRPC